MSDLERVATLDFIIGVLKEHEKALDSIGSRLERSLKDLRHSKRRTRLVLFSCASWDDFKEISSKAEAVSFRINSRITVRALKGNYLYEFSEPHPSQADSSTEKWVLPRDPKKLRDRLALELHVPKNKVIQGELSIFP